MPGTDHLLHKVEIQREVCSTVLALREPYRSTVLLRYFEDLTASEIAARLDLPVEARSGIQ
ncbi:MAG: sigma factor-like helix-turn-helix DNA-binding protein [Planctomycetota bacterium]